jgi:hypothetical protein
MTYSAWLKQQTVDAVPPRKKGNIMFTDTRCHFRLDDQGDEKIVRIEDDFIVLTHKNLKRSFHLSLFSLIDIRD